MSVLYHGEVTYLRRTVRTVAAHANSPEEARERILAREPLKRGQVLRLSHWNGDPIDPPVAGRRPVEDELTVEIPVVRVPHFAFRD